MTPTTTGSALEAASAAPASELPRPTPVVVIGAGLAGWTTVRELRKLDPHTPITLITADRGDFYAKPTLSNALAQGRTPPQLVTTPAASMAATLRVDLLPFTPVLSIDTAQRSVVTDQGRLAYRQLVLATGAQPIRVPVAGNAADQVLSVNSLDDFSGFHQRLTAQPGPRQVVIMGAGLIGCEFANDLVAAGHHVTVADPAASPIAALLPLQASQQLQAALSNLGVVWHFGATVQSVDHAANPVPGSAAPALVVELSNGQRLEADLVLSAIGLRADTRLAAAAGLQVDRGIVVNRALATSDPHIYALGDAAQYASAGGRTLPYVMPIMNAARVLAKQLSQPPGAESSADHLVFPLMPVAIKTPALPITIAAPAPGTAGGWDGVEAGVWRFVDAQGQQRGFALSGPQTAKRGEWAKTTLVTD